MKKKNILLIAIIILLIALLIPFKINKLKDGGSIEFNGLLYSVTKYHKLAPENSEKEYIEGIKIELLGMELINTINEKEETPIVSKERVKLEDLKITAKNIDATKLVKFDGVLYGKSNVLIDYAGDFSKSIGKINFLIGEEYMPELDGETNCKELLNCNVLEANGKSMILNVNNVALLFEAIDKENIKKSNGESLDIAKDTTYSSFVGTVLEETTTYMIVEPNEDEEERKSSDKIQINYGTDHYDYLYGIGRKVIIKYTGYIKESYPAQIDTNEILTDGYEEFELTVKKSDKIAKTKILNNQELYKSNSDFDLYYYGLDEVNIFVDNKKMSLEDALRSGKMTIDGILVKANQDVSDGTIESERYDDGGTAEWYYDTYTIIKHHSLDGNRDVYIGVPEMRLNNIQ